MRSPKPDSFRLFFYQLSFLLFLFQCLGAAVLFTYAQVVSNSGDRWIVPGLLSIFAIPWLLLLYKSLRNDQWFQAFDQRLHIWAVDGENWRLIILISIASILFGGVLLFAIQQGSFYFFAPPMDPDHTDMVALVNIYYEKAYPLLIMLQPFALLMVGFGIQMVILFPLICFGITAWHDKLNQHNLYVIAGIYGFFLLVWFIIGWNRVQLEPDYTFPGWYPLGVPILDSQLLLTLILGVAFVGAWLLYTRLSKKRLTSLGKGYTSLHIDLVLGLVIWLLATVHWLSIPTQVNWFVAAPQSPNYEFYPSSDALLYDTTAQSLIVGAGYQTGELEYPRRPVYALFLALLHAIVGQNYEMVSSLQSALFAVFPVLIYFIASRLHNRLTGLLAALLVILREGNAILLADKITVSNSRMIMAEMPAAIGVSIFLVLALSWFQRPARGYISSLLIGGVVASTLLIRIEAVALIFLFICFILLYTYRSPGKWLKHTLLVVIGAVLFLAPWIYRNWRMTGLLYIERPNERLTYFMLRSGALARSTVPGAAVETETEQGPSYWRILRSNILNSHLQAILIFPDTYRIIDSSIAFFGHRDVTRFWEVCCSRENYVNRLPFWNWVQWQGDIPNAAVIPILVNLLVLSIGIAVMYKQNSLVGLLPLLIAVVHYFMSAAVRVSGGRFVQMVDWIWIIYFSAGLSALILGLYSFILRARVSGGLVEPNASIEASNAAPPSIPLRRTYILTVLTILLLGSSLPVTEWAIQPRYTQQTQQQWLEELFNSTVLQQRHPDLLATLESLPEIAPYVYQGRALYPRYNRPGQGEFGTSIKPFAPKDFSSFSFYIVGPRNMSILLPLEEKSMDVFPNGSDVLVLGCQEQGFIRSYLVYNRSVETFLVSSTYKDDIPCNP